jgi:hypothetical protein
VGQLAPAARTLFCQARRKAAQRQTHGAGPRRRPKELSRDPGEALGPRFRFRVFTRACRDGGLCGFLAHPEFAQGNGQTEFVTYVQDTGFLAQDLQLIQITFQ